MQFSWTFPQFVVNPQDGELKNVVIAINWICTGTDGNATSSASGTVKLGSPNPAEFIQYSDITQDMAFEWVSQGINMSGVETEIAKQIAALSQPIVQPQNPPF